MKREEHTSLYRKYRPQTFKNVLGQEPIISVLEGAIKKDIISHAYLFAGSRGTGKTSVARIFSREIGTSENDLYEIDAASNRGIDDIRELREGVLSRPFESRFKVYIIDEAHMLTKEAFNALLKTLEEPPEHVVFILATTEFDKLPETIVSRCQLHSFQKPSRSVLKKMIVDIVKKEGYELEPSSAELIALLSEGSFRDAHGVLQKVIISSTDKKISPDEVERVTGAPRGELVNELIVSISDSDLSRALKVLSDVSKQNFDIKVFLKLVLEKVRAILLLRFAQGLSNEIEKEYSKEDFEFLKKLAEPHKKDTKKVIDSHTLDRLLEAHEKTGHSYVRELPLELALIDIIRNEER